MTRLTAGKSNKHLRVVILGSGDRRPEILQQVESLRPVIAEAADIVAEDLNFELDWSSGYSGESPNLAIVLGGDGSILRAARYMGSMQSPVLGVNLGKLGFLADTQPKDLAKALQNIRTGAFELVDHLMMRCQIKSAGQVTHDEMGLNELAVLSGPPFAMNNIDLYVDGHLATSYSCDGLIISTPTGSTAHSLSAGGPILRNDLQAFVISPINPHTLTVRPVVDSANRVFEFVVRAPGVTTSAVLDGQVLSVLGPLDRVRIERARPVFQTVQVKGQDYYRTLRQKLGWRGNFKKNH